MEHGGWFPVLKVAKVVCYGIGFVLADSLRKKVRLMNVVEGSLAATIVVADDYFEWRGKVREILNQHPDWRIVGDASDGWEAVERASSPQPDIIILDIGLPQMNGIDAARLIRKNCPQTKIVFLSQQTDRDVIEAALTAGGTAFVLKSSAARDLPIAMVSALHAAPVAIPSWPPN